jgi:hypothetical protein
VTPTNVEPKQTHRRPLARQTYTTDTHPSLMTKTQMQACTCPVDVPMSTSPRCCKYCTDLASNFRNFFPIDTSVSPVGFARTSVARRRRRNGSTESLLPAAMNSVGVESPCETNDSKPESPPLPARALWLTYNESQAGSRDSESRTEDENVERGVRVGPE